MHFNTIAITLGLAATLGAAVPVDASTDTNPQSDGIIFPDPPPFPYRDFDDDPLDIQGLPQPVQGCLERNSTRKESNPPQSPPPREGDTIPRDPRTLVPGHHSGYYFDLLTVNKICSHGDKKMSSARPFRKFERHVFGAIKRCPEVDMKPLEDIFWGVNHKCHEKWTKQTKKPQDLESAGTEEADAAEEKDEALSDDEE